MGGAVATQETPETYVAVNPCAECGYDLGPNYIEAYDGDTCPECGTEFERTNVTPEPTRRRDHDDDYDEPTMAEQCREMLYAGEHEYLSLEETMVVESAVSFAWPDGWNWSFVRYCRVEDDYIEITWTDGSESSIERPDVDIDLSTAQVDGGRGSTRIYNEMGELFHEQ